MSEGGPFEPRPSFPAGARCATHPERDAQRTCVRCGNYMCEECISASGSGMCLSCASRTGSGGTFPFNRDNYTFDGLLNFALSRWKQFWLPLGLSYAVLVLVMYVPIFAGTIIGAVLPRESEGAKLGVALVQVVAQLVGLIAQLGLQLALFGYALDILENKPTGMARALERARKLPALILMMLIIYGAFAVLGGVGAGLFFLFNRVISQLAGVIAAGLFALAALPILIYAMLSVGFTMLELAHNPSSSAIAAMRMSWSLVEGRRWSIAGTLFVSGLISGVGVIACCIGLLASAPLGMLLYGALFLALKEPGRPNQLPVTQEWPV